MLDRQITCYLQRDGRISSSEIARQLNVPLRTLRHWIELMIERKDIVLTVIINREAFGYRMAVDVFCQVEINKVEKVAQILRNFHEINYIAYSFGDQIISIQVLVEDSNKAFEFVQKLAEIPEI